MQETSSSNNFLEEWAETWEWCLHLLRGYKVAFMCPLTITLDCPWEALSILKCMGMVSRLLLSIKVQVVAVVDMDLNTIRCTQTCNHTKWTSATKIKIFPITLVIKQWFLPMDKLSKGLLRDPLARINLLFKASIHNSNSSSIIKCSLRGQFNNNIIRTIKVNFLHKDLHFSSIILKWYLVDPCKMGSPTMDSQEPIINLVNHQGIRLSQVDLPVNLDLNNNFSSSHRWWLRVETMIHWILDQWIWRQIICLVSLWIAILKEQCRITFNFIRKDILSKEIKTTSKEVVIPSKLRCNNLHTLITTVINEELSLTWSLSGWIVSHILLKSFVSIGWRRSDSRPKASTLR